MRHMSIPTVQSGKGEVAILHKAHSDTTLLYKLSSPKQVHIIYPK